MGLNLTQTVVCDCCGYSSAIGSSAFSTVTTTDFGSAGQRLAGDVVKYYCTVHGCASALETAIASLLSTASTTHQAGIVAGVIPAH